MVHHAAATSSATFSPSAATSSFFSSGFSSGFSSFFSGAGAAAADSGFFAPLACVVVPLAWPSMNSCHYGSARSI